MILSLENEALAKNLQAQNLKTDIEKAQALQRQKEEIARKLTVHVEDLKEKFLRAFDSDLPQTHSDYLIDLDDKLHEGLLDYYPNRFIQKIMHTIFDHNRRLRRFSTQINVKEHIDIIDALLSKDEKAIRDTTVLHINESKKLTLDAYQKGYLKNIYRS